MKKYIAALFSTDIALMFILLVGPNLNATPEGLILIIVYTLTALNIFRTSIVLYKIQMNIESVKTAISVLKRKKKYKNISKLFKKYNLILTLLTKITNTFLIYIVLDSLTISIIWVILIVINIYNLIIVKKLEKLEELKSIDKSIEKKKEEEI